MCIPNNCYLGCTFELSNEKYASCPIQWRALRPTAGLQLWFLGTTPFTRDPNSPCPRAAVTATFCRRTSWRAWWPAWLWPLTASGIWDFWWPCLCLRWPTWHTPSPRWIRRTWLRTGQRQAWGQQRWRRRSWGGASGSILARPGRHLCVCLCQVAHAAVLVCLVGRVRGPQKLGAAIHGYWQLFHEPGQGQYSWLSLAAAQMYLLWADFMDIMTRLGPCWEACQLYDEKMPGLFQTESHGDGMVALSSKTYYCRDVTSCPARIWRRTPIATLWLMRPIAVSGPCGARGVVWVTTSGAGPTDTYTPTSMIGPLCPTCALKGVWRMTASTQPTRRLPSSPPTGDASAGDGEYEMHDLRLQWSFGMLLAGCSGSGKSTLTTQLVTLSSHVMIRMPTRILLFYSHMQPAYEELAWLAPCPVELLDGVKHLTKQLTMEPGTLVIIDNMPVTHAHLVSIWFMRESHHYDSSIIHLVQNIFDKDPSHRTISLKATYIVLFKNPRDMSQVSYPDKQVYPGSNGLLTAAYHDATTARAHVVAMWWLTSTRQHHRNFTCATPCSPTRNFPKCSPMDRRREHKDASAQLVRTRHGIRALCTTSPCHRHHHWRPQQQHWGRCISTADPREGLGLAEVANRWRLCHLETWHLGVNHGWPGDMR